VATVVHRTRGWWQSCPHWQRAYAPSAAYLRGTWHASEAPFLFAVALRRSNPFQALGGDANFRLAEWSQLYLRWANWLQLPGGQSSQLSCELPPTRRFLLSPSANFCASPACSWTAALTADALFARHSSAPNRFTASNRRARSGVPWRHGAFFRLGIGRNFPSLPSCEVPLTPAWASGRNSSPLCELRPVRSFSSFRRGYSLGASFRPASLDTLGPASCNTTKQNLRAAQLEPSVRAAHVPVPPNSMPIGVASNWLVILPFTPGPALPAALHIAFPRHLPGFAAGL
jgi:hypothetical protein